MRADPEHYIVRVQMLTNGNFGSASGTVTLDRPTQADVYTDLPHIPNSSLRGVIRNYWSVLSSPPHDPQEAFGTRQEVEEEPEKREENTPGRLFIGNGEVLTFPVLTMEGERCWVTPMHTVCKYMELENLVGNSHESIKYLAGSIFRGSDDRRNALCVPNVPRLNLPFQLNQAGIPEVEKEGFSLIRLLRRWFGGWIPDKERIIAVDDVTAKSLWQKASEIRDMKRIDKRKRAVSGSLRRVETVPEGALFLSFVSWYGGGTLSLEIPCVQVGSLEGAGLGFCRISHVSAEVSISEENPQFQGNTGGEVESEAEAMAKIFSAVNALNSQSAFRKKIRSVVRGFGWRIVAEGLPGALGFALAKAKPGRTSGRETEEIEAHRWLLRTLLGGEENLLMCRGSAWFQNELSVIEKDNMMLRWRWMRKFSEFELTEDA